MKSPHVEGRPLCQAKIQFQAQLARQRLLIIKQNENKTWTSWSAFAGCEPPRFTPRVRPQNRHDQISHVNRFQRKIPWDEYLPKLCIPGRFVSSNRPGVHVPNEAPRDPKHRRCTVRDVD